MKIQLLVFGAMFIAGCRQPKSIPEVAQWTTHEIVLSAEKDYANGYTDNQVWAIFKNEKGDSLVRPAFWDGGRIWKVRFAPPDTASVWTWTTFSSTMDNGLTAMSGSLKSTPSRISIKLLQHGLLRMSPGKRNVVHADGTPFLVVGDTPWALPFRATVGNVKTYANDRQQKGFNTVLLMTVQPDQFAEGPEARDSLMGFDRAFADLHEGHLNKLKPDYFQYFDSLIYTLLDHEIVPVYQPVFHGFGWKGKGALGGSAAVAEYSRYCRYLVARYGSMPAFWLVGADGNGKEQGVKPGGETIELWDAYAQPTGIHYNPADNFLATWANGDSSRCFHFNRSHQEQPWLDFQWAQTGHDGKHITHKVERMYDNKPTKGCLNGEPTYEAMNDGKNGLGWWQGHDAWLQLMHGGTMGVVYGAAGIWQWKVTTDEPGWGDWANFTGSWREAIALDGSSYVGYIAKAFSGYDFTDIERRWELTENNSPMLAIEGKLYVAYLENGGQIKIKNIPSNIPYRWFNPKSGEFRADGKTDATGILFAPDTNPWVLLVGERNTTK